MIARKYQEESRRIQEEFGEIKGKVPRNTHKERIGKSRGTQRRNPRRSKGDIKETKRNTRRIKGSQMEKSQDEIHEGKAQRGYTKG